MKWGRVLTAAVGIAAAVLLLSGCASGQQDAGTPTVKQSKKADKSSSKQSAKKAASQKSSSSKKASVKQPLWSPAKAAKLATFMKAWGKSMGQTYQAYDSAHPVDFYGEQVPNDFDKMPPAMGDQKLNYAFSTDGKANADYAIVAIYSDAATAEFADQHVYLFTLFHGQPKVLFTMQNQGNENNWLYFDVTKNAALTSGFAAIVSGKQPAKLAAVGPDSPRDAITQAEAANDNGVLSWEPIKDYKMAEALLIKKYGDLGWATAYGSANRSAPIYWTVTTADNSMSKMVYATGEITDYE